jgi:hypothetical protein
MTSPKYTNGNGGMIDGQAIASRFLIELPEVERPDEIEEPATSGAAPEADEKKAA